jgi:hypothetical protein
MDQLFKSYDLHFTRVVRSQSTFQDLVRGEIKKKHPIIVSQKQTTVASKKFWSSMSFQNLVRLSQVKKKSLPDLCSCQQSIQKNLNCY